MKTKLLFWAKLAKEIILRVSASLQDWAFMLRVRPSLLRGSNFVEFLRESAEFPGGIYNPGAIEVHGAIVTVLRGEQYRPFQLYIDSTKALNSCTPLLASYSQEMQLKKPLTKLSLAAFPERRTQRYEDFRLFRFRDKIFSNLCVFIPNTNSVWPSAIDSGNYNRQALAELDLQSMSLNYAKEVQIDFPMHGREKNFMYFEHEEDLYLLYSICPYILLKAQNWPNANFVTVLHKELNLSFGKNNQQKIHLSTNPVVLDDKYLVTIISRKAHGYGIFKTLFSTWVILIDRATLEPVKISKQCLTSGLSVYFSSLIVEGDSLLLFGGQDDRRCCFTRLSKKAIEFDNIE